MRLTSWLRALALLALCFIAGAALYTATRVLPDPATISAVFGPALLITAVVVWKCD